MHARSAVIEVPSDRVDEAVETIRERMPQYKESTGFQYFLTLVDRQGGRVLGISFWDSEDDLRASDDLGKQAREAAAGVGDGPQPQREVWEVAFRETAAG